MRAYGDWKRILEGERMPCAIVDLDAVDANLELFKAAIDGYPQTIRVASKSIRHPWLMKYILESGGEGFRGLMTFSAHEAVALAEQGFDDLLMGYPIARRDEAEAIARLTGEGTRIIATVDSPEQLPVLAAAAAAASATIPVCIDLDMSWRPLGGKLHFGVRRSAVRGVDRSLEVARAIAVTDGLNLEALLGYEAQIAGMREQNPGSRALDPVRKLIKSRSAPVVKELRRKILEALRSDGHNIGLYNGGGSGSIYFTRDDPAVTEVTVGSGFLCPHLFDGYKGIELDPAAYFAIHVVRSADAGFITGAGGGYLASGPGAADRAPIVHLPRGLTPLDMEGFGEVQTPFRCGTSSPMLSIGDPILCRHAKAGELAERFNEYLFVRGDQIIERQPTYRGLGYAFM